MLRRNQRGYTLIELITVITVVSIITLALVNFVVNISRGYQYLQVQNDASVDLANSLQRVEKVVRGTTDVSVAQASSLSIYAYFSPRDAVVDKITYSVSGTNLVAAVIPASGTGPVYTYNPANEIDYTIAKNVTSDTQFTYYDDLGNQLVGAFSVSQIKQIGIKIGTNPNTKVLRKNLTSQTIVTLRNKKTNL